MHGPLIALWLACAHAEPGAPAPEAAQETRMQTTIEVLTPRIAAARDLRVAVTLRPGGDAPAEVDTLFFTFPSVVLEVRDAAGKPVPKAPPPVPPKNDGQGVRAVTAAEPLRYEYQGSQLFGVSLAPGAYEVRFRGWPDGELTSPWARFDVE